ncbi:hypothetical protein [Neptunicella sp. SCSIO 80796]|uniref:hypothetical protein n=1 Tax=Neptunicella plasticusilytica TaxID=3117012 RepID=UPI003A4E3E65
MRNIMFSLFAVLPLCACQSVDQDFYAVNSVGSNKTMSYLVGSQVKSDSFFHDHHTTYIVNIDGQFIQEPKKHYAVPLNIEPGNHTLQVANEQGTFSTYVPLKFHAKEEESYIVKSKIVDLKRALLWIENNDGDVVTPVVIAKRVTDEVSYAPIRLDRSPEWSNELRRSSTLTFK